MSTGSLSGDESNDFYDGKIHFWAEIGCDALDSVMAEKRDADGHVVLKCYPPNNETSVPI